MNEETGETDSGRKMTAILTVYLKGNFHLKRGFCTDCWAKGMRDVFIIGDSKVCLDCVVKRILNQEKTERSALEIIRKIMESKEEIVDDQLVEDEIELGLPIIEDEAVITQPAEAEIVTESEIIDSESIEAERVEDEMTEQIERDETVFEEESIDDDSTIE